MSRKNRFDYVTDGSFLHVCLSVNNGEFRFTKKSHHGLWRKCLHRYLAKYPQIKVTGYQWMSNHCHIIVSLDVSEGSAAIFTQFMHDLNWRFAFTYNKQFNRKGHFFQSRYRCNVLNSHEYILACQRYIYRNPLRALMVNNPLDNVFGSYHHYATCKKDSLITCFDGYAAFGDTPRDRAREFRRFVESMTVHEEMELQQKLRKKYTIAA